VIAYGLVLGPLVGVDLRQLGRDLSPALASSAVLLAATVPLIAVLHDAGVPTPLGLMLASAAGGLAYLIALRQFFPPAWDDVRLVTSHLLPKRWGSRFAPAPEPAVTALPAELGPEPTISVVIPARNAGPWIAETLDSVLGQTRRPDEVVVVENGSTDDTEEVLARYEGRITVVRAEPRGAAAAYNRGFVEASCDYVAMCPADDVWRPEKLERQAADLRANPGIDVIFGHARHFGVDTSEYKRPPGEGLLDHDRLCRAMYVENIIPAPTSLIRRSTFERLGRFREDMLVEDYEFWMRALSDGATFFYDPHLLVDYRRHADNLSSRLLDMRLRVDHPVHKMYAGEVSRRLSRRVLAGDLRQVGRYHLDAGRLGEARRAYLSSLRYRPSFKGAVAALALALPGSDRLCSLERRYRARWSTALP